MVFKSTEQIRIDDNVVLSLNIAVDSALEMKRAPVSQIDFVLLQKEEKTDFKATNLSRRVPKQG